MRLFFAPALVKHYIMCYIKTVEYQGFQQNDDVQSPSMPRL